MDDLPSRHCTGSQGLFFLLGQCDLRRILLCTGLACVKGGPQPSHWNSWLFRNFPQNLSLLIHLPDGQELGFSAGVRDEALPLAGGPDRALSLLGMVIELSAQFRRQCPEHIVCLPPFHRQVLPQFPDKRGAAVPAGKQIQVVFCPGHGHVEQAAFLLILPLFLRVFRLCDGGQNVIQHVQQVHGIIFQAFAGMNGGEDWTVPGRVRRLSHQGPQAVQPGQEAVQAGFTGRQQAEYFVLIGVQLLLFHIVLVAQLPPDAVQTLLRRVRQEPGQQTDEAGDAVPRILGEQGEPKQLLQDRIPGSPAPFAGILRRLFGNAAAQLVVDAQEHLSVPFVVSKGDNVQNVRDDPMGKEGVIHLTAPVGHSLPVQQVDQRQSAVVIPVKDRCLLPAANSCVQQPLVLDFPVRRQDQMHVCAGLPGGADGFGMAVGILLNEPVRQPEDLRRGAVIFLHQQNPCAGISLLELHQGVRIGGPETVNALVLVAYHEKISSFPGQKMDDGVLDPGGVLGFVHADIRKRILKMGQDIRTDFQDFLGIHHLVIIVHPPLLPQHLVVPAVQLRKLVEPRVQLANRPFVQHHVLHIGDPPAQLLDGALGSKVLAELEVQIRDQLGQFHFIFHQCKGVSPATYTGIKIDDFGGNAVDGAKLRDLGAVLPKQPGEPLPHFPGGGLGIGHGQNFVRRDAAAAEHIAQAGHQHGGLSAAGHRQKQHGALHGVHRLRLLRIEPQRIFPVKYFSVHADAPSERPF